MRCTPLRPVARVFQILEFGTTEGDSSSDIARMPISWFTRKGKCVKIRESKKALRIFKKIIFRILN